MVGGKWDYPPLFACLLALVREHMLEEHERFVSPAIDSLLAVIAFTCAGLLTHSPWIALVAGGIAALTPVSVTESLTLTPRPLGAVLLTGAIASALWFLEVGGPGWLALAVTAGALVLLSHRMASQTLFFLSVVLAVALRAPVFLLIPVAGAVVAYLVSGGFYRHVLAGHIGELAFWRVHLGDRDDGHPLRLLGIGNSTSNERPGSGASGLPMNLRLPFVFAPALLPALASPLAQPLGWAPLIHGAWIWCLTGLALCLLTSTVEPLRFLGQGHRYLNATAVPASVLAAVVLAEPGSRALFAVLCLPSITMIFWVLKTKQPNVQEERRLLSDLRDISRRLRESAGPRVLCIPVGLASAVAYLAEVPVLRHMGQAALNEFSFFVPVVRRPLRVIASENRISHVVCDTRIASLSELAIPGIEVLWEGSRLQFGMLPTSVTNTMPLSAARTGA
jgi:hypothetical protein